MEKKMMMPANYNVMTEEEMTYTEGGYALGLVTSVLYTGISIYNEIWAAKNIKNFVDSHKGQGHLCHHQRCSGSVQELHQQGRQECRHRCLLRLEPAGLVAHHRHPTACLLNQPVV